MSEGYITKALAGLAFIIPAIFILRWLLAKLHGSPDEWGEERIRELERRLERGEIDREAYEQRVREIRGD